ncbi:MAG: DNA-3-methyladenine glycosylase [Pseudomonadales bacterium]|nr:DNA-3-methyladenine glycosylase [Pseudomonadales bacterium]
MLDNRFFDKEPDHLAKALLGKILRRRIVHAEAGSTWLAARIIETEAYYLTEKGSHSSLGYTEKRKAMFMKPGTIYMYYARGGDSLNFSARGKGNGVLVKSGFPHVDTKSPAANLEIMRYLYPGRQLLRPHERLCCWQTLLCSSLNLKVPEWNQRQLRRSEFRLEDLGHVPSSIVQCRRIGIPPKRDPHLLLRFVDEEHAKYCTRNPLTQRSLKLGRDYLIHRSDTR